MGNQSPINDHRYIKYFNHQRRLEYKTTCRDYKVLLLYNFKKLLIKDRHYSRPFSYISPSNLQM